MKVCHWDGYKCTLYRGVHFTIVLLIEVFLHGLDIRSTGTCQSVRLREASVLWNVRPKEVLLYVLSYLTFIDTIISIAMC